jgi:hypothetical protein
MAQYYLRGLNFKAGIFAPISGRKKLLLSINFHDTKKQYIFNFRDK